MNRTTRLAALAAGAVLGLSALSAQAALPYTEYFGADAANWRDGFGNPTTWNAAGSQSLIDGSISTLAVLAGETPDAMTTLFRGQDGFNSSGDAYVGNWITQGVNYFSFWIKQTGPAPLKVGARFAKPGNFPALAIWSDELVQPNTWTLVDFQINNTNPDWNMEVIGNPTLASHYANVFGSLANIQIFAEQGANPLNTTFSVSLDRVAAVPEPATMTLLGAGALALARRRARKA